MPQAYIAAGRIMPGRFVAPAGMGRVIQATTATGAAGLSQRTLLAQFRDQNEIVQDGQYALTYLIGERAFLELAAPCTALQTLRPDDDGRGVPDSECFAVQAIQGGQAGDFIEVLIVRTIPPLGKRTRTDIEADWLIEQGVREETVEGFKRQWG